MSELNEENWTNRILHSGGEFSADDLSEAVLRAAGRGGASNVAAASGASMAVHNRGGMYSSKGAHVQTAGADAQALQMLLDGRDIDEDDEDDEDDDDQGVKGGEVRTPSRMVLKARETKLLRKAAKTPGPEF